MGNSIKQKKKSRIYKLLYQRTRHAKKLTKFFFGLDKTKLQLLWQLKSVLRSYHGLIHPSIYTIFYKSFISNSLSIEQKLKILIYHNQTLKQKLTPAAITALFSHGIPLYTENIPSGSLQLLLKTTKTADYREGALSLFITLNAFPVYVISFVLAPGELHSAKQAFLYLSRIQSVTPHFEDIQKVTKEMQEINPAKLLIHALEGIAIALHIKAIIGVQTKDQVLYIEIEDIERFDKKYNGLWQSFTGHHKETLGYSLPVPLQLKPINTIAQKHRNRTILKQKKLRNISAGVAATFAKSLL